MLWDFFCLLFKVNQKIQDNVLGLFFCEFADEIPAYNPS